MTKISRQKRRKKSNITKGHEKAKGRTFISRKNIAVTKVQTRKSIKRPIGLFKQLNILKKDQNMFSTLQFKALPNEIIFHVFSYLKIVDLLKCGQVSKRFRAISIDVWPEKINLCHQKVPVKFLQKLL